MEITAYVVPKAALSIPRLDDGFVNMQEPLRQLAGGAVISRS